MVSTTRVSLLGRLRGAAPRLNVDILTGRPVVDETNEGILPNFCHGWTAFNAVVIAELIAIIVALVSWQDFTANAFSTLLYVSILAQWIALTSVGVLCAVRRPLNRLPPNRAVMSAYLILLAVTLVVSEAAVWTLWLVGKLPELHPNGYAYYQLRNLFISAIVNAFAIRYFVALHESKRRSLSEARAKIEALQARIRPHFVFNSLNIIASLTRTAPDKAESAIEDMADLFRKMLNTDETLVPVKNEIDIANKYLALERLRLDNRLRTEWDIGTFPRKAVMPVLMLQPLLENAIRNGVETLTAGGMIGIRLWEEADHIHIKITNPIPKSRPKDDLAAQSQVLDDIHVRLNNHYGDTATLETTEVEDRFTVTVVLPNRGGNL
jgi:two-component system sensor histidine kinase AlgZ